MCPSSNNKKIIVQIIPIRIDTRDFAPKPKKKAITQLKMDERGKDKERQETENRTAASVSTLRRVLHGMKPPGDRTGTELEW